MVLVIHHNNQKEYFIDYYFNNLTLQEIADIYEVSRERIRQIKALALFKIERQIVNKI